MILAIFLAVLAVLILAFALVGINDNKFMSIAVVLTVVLAATLIDFVLSSGVNFNILGGIRDTYTE